MAMEQWLASPPWSFSGPKTGSIGHNCISQFVRVTYPIRKRSCAGDRKAGHQTFQRCTAARVNPIDSPPLKVFISAWQIRWIRSVHGFPAAASDA